MATRTFVARFGFDTKDVAKGAREVSKNLNGLQSNVRKISRGVVRSTQNFVAGFMDADAAASALTGRIGKLGGLTRRALSPGIRQVTNFVAGFRDADAAASAFSGRLGTVGGLARRVLNPGIRAVANFTAGFQSTDAAASAFTGRLGTIGGVARRALNPAISAVSAVGGVLGTVGRHVGTALGAAGRTAGKVASGIGTAFSSVASNVRTAFSQIAPVISGVASAAANTVATASAVAVTAVTALGGAAIASGMSYNVLQQKSRAAFTTILGSAEAANAMMGQLAEFAKTSPFPRQAFISATQQMLAFGFAADDVIPTLQAIQDAVAATGGSAEQIGEITSILSQVKSTGKLTAETFNQLGYRGIDAAKLIGQGMNMTAQEVRDAVTGGTLDSQKALKTLVAEMTTTYAGAADGLKSTWEGATDRIKGVMRDVGSVIVAPFVDPNGGGYAIEWANKLADLGRAIEASLGPAIERSFERLGPILDKVSPALDSMVAGVKSLSEGEGPAAGLLDKLREFAPVLAPLAAGLATLGGANVIAALGPLAALLGPLGPVGVAVAAAIAALVAVMPQLRSSVAEAGQVIADSFAPVLPVLQDAFTKAMPPIRQLATIIGKMLVIAVRAIAPLIAAVVAAIAPLIPIVLDTAVQIGQALLPVVQKLGTLISSVTPIIKALAPVLQWVAQLTGTLLVGAIRVLANVFGWLIGLVTSIINAIVSGFTWLYRVLVGNSIIPDLINAILFWWRLLSSTVIAIVRAIWNTVVAVFTWLATGVVAVVTTLRNGVVNGFTWLRDRVVGAATNVKDRALSIFGTLRDGAVNIFDRLRNAVAGAFEALIEKVKSPLRTLFDWMNRSMIKPLNKVTEKFGIIIPELPKFHTGGVIPGRGEKPIMALGGEGVVSPRGMRRLGKRGLDAINRGEAFGGPFDFLGDLGSTVGGWLKKGAAYALGKILDPVLDTVGNVIPGPAMVRDLVVGTLRSVVPAIKRWGEGKDADEAAKS
ncbi:tape measure protein, partial [uncultured Aeromicrobium sp.]|uniref:tape measure protein n=1 Tax=uncultured Aeromicrobium sp. TaxID=337820 RepID=UPI0025DC6FC0